MTMSTATVGRQPNLYQLAVELGDATIGWRMIARDGTWTVRTVDVEQATLDAAVAAHVPDWDVAPPPTDAEIAEQTAAANTQTVDQRLRGNLGALRDTIDPDLLRDRIAREQAVISALNDDITATVADKDVQVAIAADTSNPPEVRQAARDERDRLIAVIDGLRADKDRAGEGIQIARAALTSRRVLLDLIRMVLGGDLLATVDAVD